MATTAKRADAQLEEIARYRVIHRPGGGTTLLLSFRNGEQVELVSQEQADLILGLLGKARSLSYDRVQQELQVEEIPPGILASFSPSVDYWLVNEQKIRNSIIWEKPGGPHAYSGWAQWRKDALQAAFADAWRMSSTGLTDPPPNLLHPGNNDYPTTALSTTDAWALYLASVGQSLAMEIGARVAWRAGSYSQSNRAILFDSREFFVWTANDNGYELQDVPGGWVVPAAPDTMYAFLKNSDLIGKTRQGTIVRLIKWCRLYLNHMLGAYTAETFENIWGYRGFAPVLRTITGTTDLANPAYGERNWTAACHGTAGFLRAILRTVNIPVVHDHQAGHALPYFSADRVYLSHADDPYHSYIRPDPAFPMSDPIFPMSEILISQTTYDSWFGAGVSESKRNKNVGRRTVELAIQYLPLVLLRLYCDDQAAGRSHANGNVAASLHPFTIAELDAFDLWSRMDTQIAASYGGCAQLPPPWPS
ncbi:MAG: hypothetical protein WA269_06040 [Candidatus Udaeobacter sp.]